jgi:putative colanic acid biosynthesis acetyltransferase WcaF
VKPIIPGDRRFAVKVAWYVASVVLFETSLALLPSSFKSAVLRWFGATIGAGVVIRPKVTIKCPWFLRVGDNTWIGREVFIDNPGPVVIGSNVCISQRALLITGNHDYHDPQFAFFANPVRVGDRVWLCASTLLAPGSIVPEGTVVPIGSVWRNLPFTAAPPERPSP